MTTTTNPILASLNRDLIAGRCLIEQDFPSTQGNLRLRVVLEKTLLATDLDLGEFGVTLLFWVSIPKRS